MGLNILIVDDSAMMRAIIKRVANLTGMSIGTVFEAANGAEALAVLKANDVQVLFTDINMPVMSGIELLRAISADARWKNLLRVIISTDGSEARRNEVRDLDVRIYVEKPFRPEVMRDVLATLATEDTRVH